MGKALSTARKLREKIKKYRFVSFEEEEKIDDFVIDLLRKLAAKVTNNSKGPELFEIGFNKFLKWGEHRLRRKTKKKLETISLYDEHNRLRFDKIDESSGQTVESLLAELDIPYKDKVRRLLEGEPFNKVFPSDKLRKRWQRTQLPKLRKILSEIYEMDSDTD